MTKKNPELLLRQFIARWSDEHLEECRKFLLSYKDLLQRELGNNQFYGLANIIRNAPELKRINVFMKNQALKAKRAGKVKVGDFWSHLERTLERYREDAIQMAQDINPRWGKDNQRIDYIHRQLSHFFVQHMIAEFSMYSSFKERDVSKKEK